MNAARNIWSLALGLLLLAPVLSAPPGAIAQEAAPPAPASKARPSTPRNVRVWASQIQQNYPREAVLRMLQGSVRIRVTVNPEGRASNCLVLQSSGHDVLDRAACDGMRQFALFNPALDDEGRPISSTYATIITYRLTTPQILPVPGAEQETI